MAQGFDGLTPGEIAAERSLEKSSRELRTLKKVIEKYKDDPKGKKKMPVSYTHLTLPTKRIV